MKPVEIAIVGMSGRFPGAASVERFWENLVAEVESIARFSEADLVAEGLPPSLLRRPDYVNAGGALEGVDLFDAEFFGFTPREAEILDPQQRMFLECVWEALERAGYDPRAFEGPIGLFAGAGASTHLVRLHEDRELLRMLGAMQVSIGAEKDHLPTQIAYKLDLRGPAVAVQTSCSSSLVAVCLACSSLAVEECEIALAGGVSVQLPQRTGYLYREGGILSPDGRCRAFDARARGAVGGNGATVVVLRRLRDALAAGDRIHAVVRGYALNNDGSVKIGYTAPSIEGQARVIEAAQRMAGVSPDSIGYVEAHGTGTPLGDPIEVAALVQAFARGTERRQFCGLGSVKTNVGHLDAAAGAAGLIKAALAVETGTIPASLHFERPNPQSDLARSPFFVVARTQRWPEGASPRRAGVSSFGIGGTNAHVVLEEPPPPEPAAPGRDVQLLALSARTPSALERRCADLAAYLERHPELPLPDVAFTLAAGRRHFPFRRTVISTRAGASAALASGGPPPARAGAPRPLVYLFPGQGAQYSGMGLALAAREHAFRRELDACARLLAEDAGLDLDALLRAPRERMRRTEAAQPALFAVSYALARLFIAWGAPPRAMLGHSIGEYVAAALAGVFSLRDALRLVVARGRLMQALPPGAMTAVALGEAELRERLAPAFAAGALGLAAVNAPAACVVSGTHAAVEAAEAALQAQGAYCRRLEVSHAFHSPMMDVLRAPFEAVLETVAFGAPALPYGSNVTGRWIEPAQAADPAYWWRHLRETVRFADGVATVAGREGALFAELGPGNALASLARQHPAAANALAVTTLGHAEAAGAAELERSLEAFGRLWAAGAEIALPAQWSGERRRRVPLPTYPFERKRFRPLRPAPPAPAPAPARDRQARKDPDPARWFYAPSWRRAVAPAPAAPPARRWLVLADEGGLGAELAEELRRVGSRVVEARAAGAYERAGDRVALDPREPAHYRRLLDETGPFERIVHAWSLDAEREPSAEGLGRAAALGFDSALLLVQALLAPGDRTRVGLVLLSDRMQEVDGTETLAPAAAALRALATVVPQEHPHLDCRSVDVNLAGGFAPLLAPLFAELTAASDERFVALRGAHRWVQRFEPLAPRPDAPPLFKRNGVYVLTGAFGRIGSLLARHLASAWNARLVLCGRHPREAFARELEGLGGEALAVAADVADPAALAAAFAAGRQRFGRIDGAIHLAGAVTGPADFAPVVDSGSRLCEAQLAAKAGGALNLAAAVADEPLEFVLLFSSLSAVLGGLGYLAYAAANCVLDALATARARTGNTRWLSAAWDGWNFGGAAAGTALAKYAIEPAEGVRAIELLAGVAHVPAVVVSTGDLETRLQAWVRPQPASAPSASGAAASAWAATASAASAQAAPEPAAAYERPALSSEYRSPQGEVETAVCQILQGLLGIERIGTADNFFELGGQSLLAIQLLSRLRERFDVDVSVQELFDAPTLGAFARCVDEARRGPERDDARLAELLDEIERLSDEEVLALLAATDPAAPEPQPSAPAAPALAFEEFAREIEPLGNGREPLPHATVREFYNRVTAQLDVSEAASYALFLNFGYAGEPAERRSQVELPARLVNRNSVELVLETVAGCELAGRTVLDVGCGRGGTLVTLRRYHAAGPLWGVDLSPAAIAFCNREHRLPEARFVVGDALQLPLADASVEVVTNLESSHTYPDLARFFGEVARVLRPGGVFCYTDLLPLAELPARIAAVERAGLRLVLDRDVTANVLRSCDQIAAMRRGAFGDRNDERVMREFLATPDSAVYRDMRDGRTTYRILRFGRKG